MRLPLLAAVFCVLVLGLGAGGRLAAAELPVVILANQDDPDSLALARHYAEKRGLPETAIVALRLPLTEQITWDEFVVTLWNPLLRLAIERGWIFASRPGARDAVGRDRIISSGHRLRALVVCRGVPLRIAHDLARYDPKTNPLTANPSLRTTESAVDSELALLACDDPPVAAFVPNPLFRQDDPSALLREQILPVGRLDGPSLAEAKGLVDRALVAERDGLAGRAYVDIGGPHRQGDLWLEECLPELRTLGFETDVDRAPGTLADGVRFDAPALYFGWYTGSLNGPFADPDFRFPPGAVALHIHSFSAATLRSPAQGWCGPLVAKGVTATFGNVGEPYLEFTHQPQLLLRALARGEPLGQAALYAINSLSWKGIVIGDPLYRPFAVSADEQWRRRKTLPPETELYARLRRMQGLATAGQAEEALAVGAAGLVQNPGLPLSLALGSLRRADGDASGARLALQPFVAIKRIRRADRPLVLVAARGLHAAGASRDAVDCLRRLLEDTTLPRQLRLDALLAGAEAARAAREMNLASRWATEHAALTAPPPAPPAAAPAKP